MRENPVEEDGVAVGLMTARSRDDNAETIEHAAGVKRRQMDTNEMKAAGDDGLRGSSGPADGWSSRWRLLKESRGQGVARCEMREMMMGLDVDVDAREMCERFACDYCSRNGG